mgnify:CR=1 FL=1
MEKISDSMKKILLAGIGAAATTAEKSKEILDDLVKKGELTVEQGKVLNEELKHNVKQTFQKEEQDPADVLKGMTLEQIEALKAAIADMETKAADEEAVETEAEAAKE